jgi:hypothetical protein
MTSFHLKLIAVISMLLDHMQIAFPAVFPIEFRLVGRLAFPLFAFLIAEGFRRTRSPEKFLLRLFLFALISEPFFDYFLSPAPNFWSVGFLNNTNIFYTLFLGGAAVTTYRYVMNRHNVALLAVLPAVGFAALAVWLTVDYSWMGVAFIFALYITKKTPARLFVMAAMCLFLWSPLLAYHFMGQPVRVAGNPQLMIAATLLSVPLAACFNGKRGPAVKWFFYIFYPAHMAVLGGISFFLSL